VSLLKKTIERVHCMGAFLDQAKRNKSIADAVLNLRGSSIDDLSEVIQNNKALKKLELFYPEQSVMCSWKKRTQLVCEPLSFG
jgi:hypothetical protein